MLPADQHGADGQSDHRHQQHGGGRGDAGAVAGDVFAEDVPAAVALGLDGLAGQEPLDVLAERT